MISDTALLLARTSATRESNIQASLWVWSAENHIVPVYSCINGSVGGYHPRRHVPRLLQGMILDLLPDQVPAVCIQVLLDSLPTPNLGCVAQTSPQYLATALGLYRSCYGDRGVVFILQRWGS